MELPEGYTNYIQELKANGKLNETPLANGTILNEIKINTLLRTKKSNMWFSSKLANEWWKKFKQVIRYGILSKSGRSMFILQKW
jgi:hypothetical protein